MMSEIDEEDAGEQDGEAMVAAGHPRDRAVGERAQDRGEPRGEAPQAEEFRAAPGGREVGDQRAPGRLARSHAQAREVGGDPEQSPGVCEKYAITVIAIQPTIVRRSATTLPMRSCA